MPRFLYGGKNPNQALSDETLRPVMHSMTYFSAPLFRGTGPWLETTENTAITLFPIVHVSRETGLGSSCRAGKQRVSRETGNWRAFSVSRETSPSCHSQPAILIFWLRN